jgi:hypothetical protein
VFASDQRGGVRRGPRQLRARNEALAQIYRKWAGRKPKSLLWISRAIRDLFVAKAMSDEACDRKGVRRYQMSQFMFKWAQERYGARPLVESHLGSILVTVERRRGDSMLVRLFSKLVEESWDLGVLNVCLRTYRLCDELHIGYGAPAHVHVPTCSLHHCILR